MRPESPAGPAGADESGRPTAPAVLWTPSTMFAEGLPWSLLHQVAAEFFTALGLPARQVGYTSALHLAGSFKFVWSPIVDLFGSLRQWMIATQAIMGGLVGLLAVHAGTLERAAGIDTTWIWLLLVITGIVSATHDIACDGYYMDALDRDDQARHAGLRIAGFRAAMFVGAAGLVYLGGRFGWLVGFGAGAVLLLVLAAFHRLALPRGRGERVSRPRTQKEARSGRRVAHVLAAYLSFFRQPQAIVVLLFIASFKLGDALMFSMFKVLLRDLGVETTSRALVNGVGTAAMILGAMVGGAWIARVGLARSLVPIALIMALSEPLLLLLAADTIPRQLAAGLVGAPIGLEPPLTWAGAVLAVEQFAGGMATSGQMVFIMRRCHPEHKAAHYAFATALYSFAQVATGTYSGVLYESQGPILYFAVTSVACIPALVLVGLVPTRGPADIVRP